MTATETAHIRLDKKGVAWIDDSNVKVIEVVRDWLANNSTVEEMHFQYPHLSLAQIHASLAYYYDHHEKFEAQIKKELVEIEKQAAKSVDSPARRRLKLLGKLR